MLCILRMDVGHAQYNMIYYGENEKWIIEQVFIVSLFASLLGRITLGNV